MNFSDRLRPGRDSCSPRPLKPFWSPRAKWIRIRSHVSVVNKYPHICPDCVEGLGEIHRGEELSTYPTSSPQRRVYWAGEQEKSSSIYSLYLKASSFPKVMFQEVGGKPDKKRAALAHFDTIFGLDQVMVQLTIRAVLVSLVKVSISRGECSNPGRIICWLVVSDEVPTRQQEESCKKGEKEQLSGHKKYQLNPLWNMIYEMIDIESIQPFSSNT